MARSAALYDLMLLEEANDIGWAAEAGGRTFTISAAHTLSDVESVWRSLTLGNVESPGQSFDFIRLWVDALQIPERNQFYVTALHNDVPIALLPLQRRVDKGVRILSWFPGPHVGCNAPIVDVPRLRALSSDDRRKLWLRLLRSISGADVVYLKAVPQLMVDGVDLFGELGQIIDADTLYRASFSSFAEADKTQRNKSRRKHDRQQGDKLNALGEVGFREVENGPEAIALLGTMFQQRSARFREMGVFDPFTIPVVRRFYDSTVSPCSKLPVKLHVLTLNGEVVAMRYNVVHGERIFCLISSMSDDPAIQHGSPGKQCLLRVMQTAFDEGSRVFDMGAGFTDEKRHWCNDLIPVRHHYVPITRRGAVAASAHRSWQVARRRIKNDERLLRWAKDARGLMLRLKGQAEAAPAAHVSDD
jgi:CelD/BcsL family acetyltransferase involved in cellulose biosynthesis